MARATRKKPAKAKPAKDQLWGGRMKEKPDPANIAFCAGRDVHERPMADAVLVPFDVWQNLAHVAMLAECDIIPKSRARAIAGALRDFEREVAAGRRLDPRKEDVHTNIEHFVAGKLGPEVSGQIHTARSRNDQTTTVVRLFVRDRLLAFGASLAVLADALAKAATRYAAVPMAGMTHYQPGSLMTVGHLFASHAQALTRDLERVADAADRLNVSPLGAAASFGTSWPINRKRTAQLLGFREVQANTLDCVTNRWEMEAEAASVLSFAMTHLSMLAQDIIILSLPQFGVLKVADRYVTGSSIMPQKRNPDFAEVTRARAALVTNLLATLFSIARGLPSGYNRDTQWSKYVILDAFEEAAGTPDVFRGVVDTITVDRRAARAGAAAHFVDAVDVADAIAREGRLPFRAAYDIVSRAVKECEAAGRIDPAVVDRLLKEAGHATLSLKLRNPEEIVARKSHIGGPAPAAVRRDTAALRTRIRSATVRVRKIAASTAAARLRTDDAFKSLK